MKNIRFSFFIAVFCTLIITASCSNETPKNTGNAQTQQQTDHEMLTNRANQRWAAIIAGDYDGAYAFESPAYRAVNDSTHFKFQFAGQVIRNNAEAVKIEMSPENSTSSTVVVEIDFAAVVGGQLVESNSYSRETWVKRDGQWWHVSKQ